MGQFEEVFFSELTFEHRPKKSEGVAEDEGKNNTQKQQATFRKFGATL